MGVPAHVRYTVVSEQHRVLIILDGIIAAAATYHLAVGPVTGIEIRPAGSPVKGTAVILTSRTALSILESFAMGETLVLRFTPGKKIRPLPSPPTAVDDHYPGEHATTSVPPVSIPAPRDALPEMIAGRILISRTIRLVVGGGQVIAINGLIRVAVGDPAMLDTVPVSNRELLVSGRSPGHTTMYIWEGTARLLAYAVDVVPSENPLAALERLLRSLLPGAAVTVTEVPAGRNSTAVRAAARTNGTESPNSPAYGTLPPPGSTTGMIPPIAPPIGVSSIPNMPESAADLPRPPVVPSEPQRVASEGPTLILSGTVETQMDFEKAERIAQAFAPVVVNLLNIHRPVQLKLRVEVVELSRSVLNSLGITWGGAQLVPGAPPSLNGGVYNLQLITAPGFGINGLDVLLAQIQALSQHGLARLLAEPTLVVLAGQQASLLLGGQVPIPIAGPYGSVTVDYKDFGVILTARPDYQDDGRVFMHIAPEVSTLDFTNAIKVSGFTLPALQVRRVETQISMLPAQTLVLGGLFQRQDSDVIQKIPLIGDLPIIGPLFRSRTFQHQESDLIIFITPMLVDAAGSQPAHP